MSKSTADLVHMLRLMGADSPAGEGRDSIINRILMFQRQKWGAEKPRPKIVIEPVTKEVLTEKLMPYILRGVLMEVKDGCWFVEIGDRKDSGSLCMPLSAIERVVKYLMPKDAL